MCSQHQINTVHTCMQCIHHSRMYIISTQPSDKSTKNIEGNSHKRARARARTHIHTHTHTHTLPHTNTHTHSHARTHIHTDAHTKCYNQNCNRIRVSGIIYSAPLLARKVGVGQVKPQAEDKHLGLYPHVNDDPSLLVRA